MKSNPSIKTSPPSHNPKRLFPVFFFAALFYLCSADQFFSVRFHGFNFRAGQFLLLVVILVSIRDFFKKGQAPHLGKYVGFAATWGPFFLVYAISAIWGDSPWDSFLKLGWAFFNIIIAGFLFLNSRWSAQLERGFYYGILAIALTIWIQVIAIYFCGATPIFTTPAASEILYLPGFHLFPLGFAQVPGKIFHGLVILRPNAFYYEPSYAGCALAFAFPLLLVINHNLAGVKRYVGPALVFSAVILTSSRSGWLGLIVGLTAMISGSFFGKQKSILVNTFKCILGGTFLLILVALTGPGQKYFGYMIGPLGPQKTLTRISDPKLDEGFRIAAMKASLKLWRENPWLGHGVVKAPNYRNRKLAPTVANTWLEILIEAGGFGLLAFLYALFKTLRDSTGSGPFDPNVILVLSAVLVHLTVDMNFTGTFPRLDYWLLFFLAAHLLRRSRPQTP